MYLIMSPHVYHGDTYGFTPFCLSDRPSVCLSHFCQRNSYTSQRIWMKLSTKQDDDVRFVDFCNSYGGRHQFLGYQKQII
jgi:hypothetical protein